MIDAAPRVSELGRAAILASDLVLIPVQPSPLDIWASADVVRLIAEARQFKENLNAVFAVNRKVAGTAIARGLSVIEAEPHSEAAREITRLADSVLNGGVPQ